MKGNFYAQKYFITMEVLFVFSCVKGRKWQQIWLVQLYLAQETLTKQ